MNRFIQPDEDGVIHCPAEILQTRFDNPDFLSSRAVGLHYDNLVWAVQKAGEHVGASPKNLLIETKIYETFLAHAVSKADDTQATRDTLAAFIEDISSWEDDTPGYNLAVAIQAAKNIQSFLGTSRGTGRFLATEMTAFLLRNNSTSPSMAHQVIAASLGSPNIVSMLEKARLS